MYRQLETLINMKQAMYQALEAQMGPPKDPTDAAYREELITARARYETNNLLHEMAEKALVEAAA